MIYLSWRTRWSRSWSICPEELDDLDHDLSVRGVFVVYLSGQKYTPPIYALLIGCLRRICLGCVSCSLFPVWNRSQNARDFFFFAVGKKKWPEYRVLTFFFSWVGLALGWGVRRFHHNILYAFQPNRVWSKSQTPYVVTSDFNRGLFSRPYWYVIAIIRIVLSDVFLQQW